MRSKPIREAGIPIPTEMLIQSRDYITGLLFGDVAAGLEPAILDYLDYAGGDGTSDAASGVLLELSSQPKTTELLHEWYFAMRHPITNQNLN